VREAERLSALIGDIYDAALDPELWIDVLEKAAKFVGGPAASIYSRDAVSRTASAAYQFGLEPRWGCFPDFWRALAKCPLAGAAPRFVSQA